MATYKAEALYQRYRGKLRPACPLLPRLAAPTGPAGVLRPKIANSILNAPATARLIKRLGGIDERRPLPRFAAQSFRRWFASRARPRRHPAPAASRSCSASTPLPDTFSPQVGQAAVRVLRPPGLGPDNRATACCGLTWISTDSSTVPASSCATPWTSSAPHSTPAFPSSALSRPASRPCAAIRRAPSPRPARAEARGAVKSLAALLRETDGWTPPDLSGSPGWPSRTATTARPAAGRTTPRCCASPGRRSRRGRLLRASGKLRRRAGPLRGLGEGGRDRPAARRPGSRARCHDSRRRLLLPHPARPAGGRTRYPPGGTAGGQAAR